jgi:hypothetical protein
MKKVARMRRSRDRWKDKATKRAESKSENLGKPKRGSKVGLSGCKRELRPLSSQSHKKKKRLTNR